jgi:predicted HTH transcriptional regulator
LGEKLGENEIKIIELMKDNKYITAKELSEHIKISTTLAFPPPSRGRFFQYSLP